MKGIVKVEDLYTDQIKLDIVKFYIVRNTRIAKISEIAAFFGHSRPLIKERLDEFIKEKIIVKVFFGNSRTITHYHLNIDNKSFDMLKQKLMSDTDDNTIYYDFGTCTK